MKLYIKQKVFSIGAKYNICTAEEKPVYTAEGEIFTIGAKVHLYDTEGCELLNIKQKLLAIGQLFETPVSQLLNQDIFCKLQSPAPTFPLAKVLLDFYRLLL